MAKRLNQDTFAPFIAKSELPILADFYQDGCIPCRRVAPLLNKMEGEYAGKLVIARVNLIQSAGLAEQYNVTAAPTLVLFQSGKEVARHRGVITRDELKEFIESILSI